MKKLKKYSLCIFSLLIIGLLSSCENEAEVQSNIDILKKQRSEIERQIGFLQIHESHKIESIQKLNEELKLKGMLTEGKTPKYILTFELKQSHFTIDIGEHIKDEMNAIEFEMAVDKDLYNSVSEGTKIVDEFRAGSLIMNGSFGDWEMKVKNKRIE
jgi:hypothetical protein